MMATKTQNPVVVVHKVTDEQNSFNALWYDIKVDAPCKNLYAHLSDDGTTLFTIGDSPEENKLFAINQQGDIAFHSNKLEATLGSGNMDSIKYLPKKSLAAKSTIFSITKNLQPTL